MRVVFIGTGEIGVPTLHALLGSEEHQLAAVVTQPDKPVGRDQRIEPSPIKKALAGTKIPILQPARIKDRQSIDEISARSPQDRKSTRLNSSHSQISYAVFCLKKKQ